MNIWYLNHYATPPDKGLPGRPYNFAQNMNKLGHEVTIFCASYHHLRKTEANSSEFRKIKRYGGVDYFYMPTRAYHGNGPKRLMNMIDYAREVRELLEEVKSGALKKPDVLIPSCAHHLVYLPALKIARKMGAKTIYEVRDIWPLSLVEIASVPSWHPFILWSAWIERKAYRSADAVVSLLPNAYEHMGPLGLERRRFYFIPNGVEPDEWENAVDLPTEKQIIFQKLNKKRKLIVLYAGAHGVPNALDQILDLNSTNFGREKPYHFILIGDGSEKRRLIREVRDRKISFISFWPRIPKSQVITALKCADVCFLGWGKNNIYRYGVSPNKLSDYLMSATPILNSGDIGNDLVRVTGAGISIEPYNKKSLEAALLHFCSMSKTEREMMGLKGMRYALENLTWKKLACKYEQICSRIVTVDDF